MNESIPALPLFPWWKKTNLRITLGFFLIAIFVARYAFDLGLMFPPSFDGTKTVTVYQGESADKVARALLREGLIRQRFDFLLYMKITGKDTKIKPGTYSFQEPLSAPRIAAHITGNSAERAIRTQEGWTNFEIARYLEHEGIMAQEDFIKAADGKEGYLFPDTYRIFQNVSAEELTGLFEKTFYQKTEQLRAEAEQRKILFSDIIIMASLIEKESSGGEDRAIISGILWKRLLARIPLQVDAAVSYLTGKTSKDLTADDLNIDSLYNTYRYVGLPIGPIGNPGLEAIKAALYPQKTPYWFYLHDKEGDVYYAKTFDEHKENKERHLR